VAPVVGAHFGEDEIPPALSQPGVVGELVDEAGLVLDGGVGEDGGDRWAVPGPFNEEHPAVAVLDAKLHAVLVEHHFVPKGTSGKLEVLRLGLCVGAIPCQVACGVIYQRGRHTLKPALR
jgi:hypothetical protein